ncbi:endonuclease/exonuclease/phosphatase [Niabella ginsenosidivorans]|uniref:Endonuclease/exonuclease/phosphatase n=1 Tax=Niabella ginsenosidivorans TaxID=1176587 RepID=A0A1A9I1R3_9BACT|nr:endonuclease/exonuclease/phosphatase [Niabella ginsenosidivorans]ANH81566.1 endonuclease/exonuclease/phosphatase [Niabella ginsenosidivorans]
MKYTAYTLLLLTSLWACKKETVPGNPSPEDTTQLKNYNKNLTIVNWNMEWFGDASAFKGDLNEQAANAGLILNYLKADLYGLCEVVDTARFGNMIRQYLGNEFRYLISPYPKIDQKLAIVYNRNIFRNVSARPFMAVSATAAVSFANGRFPFLFMADAVVNGTRKRVYLILLHAKSGTTVEAYTHRLDGSAELKDSLDHYWSDQDGMILGDYNDHFNNSILEGRISPYKNFTDDTLSYLPVTLPLNSPGHQSTIGYPNSVIDQQIVTGNMKQWYMSNSVQIRTDVQLIVPRYTTNNTSDHYPVSSVFRVTD